jgi:hypothetical protein
VRTRLLALALLTAAACAGCDGQGKDGVPATGRAFAYVAAEYVGVPQYATSDALPYYVQFQGHYVETVLRTKIGNPDKDPARGGEYYPGDAVHVLAGTEFEGQDPTTCDDEEPYPYCEPLEGGGAMTWTLEDPEEDPGYVKVAVRKGEVTVVVVFSGPHITRDARTMELPVTIDQLVDIARDDRVDLTTTQAAVDAGAALDYWEETAPPVGEPQASAPLP